MALSPGRLGWQGPLAVLGITLLLACGGKNSGETDPAVPLPTDTMTGTVTFKGAPLAGVQVLLYSTNSNVFAQTTSTDGNGNYSFPGLGTMGDATADWLVWCMSSRYGFVPKVGSAAQVQRCGCNNFLLGYNTGGIGLDVTGIHYDSLPSDNLTGADFTACDGSQPLVALARTGQLTSYAAGDDASLGKGVAWPAVRFTDNQDGTVTDHLTGLIWLKNASTFAPDVWLNALADVDQISSGNYGLSDGSKAGDWRLPNVNELESLIDVSASAPALTPGFPFTHVALGNYWTSTPVGAGNEGSYFAWAISLADGRYVDDEASNVMATSSNGVWAVKGNGGGVVQLQATGMEQGFFRGDDGTVQSGVAFPYPRWIVNGDGTSTDTLTGLVWLQQANAINLPWAEALAAVNALASGQYGLSDGSAAGSWRMPTRNEIQSLTDRDQANMADFFINTFDYANGSLYQPAVFANFIPLQFYWTSTTYAPDPTQAWTAYSCDFGMFQIPKSTPGYTLAVR